MASNNPPDLLVARQHRVDAPDEPPADHLLGVAIGALRAAMSDENSPLLRSYVQQLRARGLAEAELSRVYATLRERRHPDAPTLRQLESRS